MTHSGQLDEEVSVLREKVRHVIEPLSRCTVLRWATLELLSPAKLGPSPLSYPETKSEAFRMSSTDGVQVAIMETSRRQLASSANWVTYHKSPPKSTKEAYLEVRAAGV